MENMQIVKYNNHCKLEKNCTISYPYDFVIWLTISANHKYCISVLVEYNEVKRKWKKSAFT